MTALCKFVTAPSVRVFSYRDGLTGGGRGRGDAPTSQGEEGGASTSHGRWGAEGFHSEEKILDITKYTLYATVIGVL